MTFEGRYKRCPMSQTIQKRREALGTVLTKDIAVYVKSNLDWKCHKGHWWIHFVTVLFQSQGI